MSTTKNARTSAVIAIAILTIFASIAILESSSLRWPLASEIQNLSPNQSANTNSSLLISVTGFSSTGMTCAVQQNSTEVDNNSSSGLFCTSGPASPPFGFPIFNASITVYTTNTPQLIVASNTTDFDGTRLFVLKSGLYEVTMISIFGNATAFVKTDPGNTTELDITMNSTTYYTSFFEISSSAPTLIAPWDDIFLNVHTTSPIVHNGNSSIFVVFIQRSALQISNKYGIQIINEYLGPQNTTLWLQAQLNSTASTMNLSQVVVLSFVSSFSIREYPMSNSTVLAPTIPTFRG